MKYCMCSKDNINFVIRDFEGKYYKMRFIDFYNSQGLKGYPKFELEELKVICCC